MNHMCLITASLHLSMHQIQDTILLLELHDVFVWDSIDTLVE